MLAEKIESREETYFQTGDLVSLKNGAETVLVVTNPFGKEHDCFTGATLYTEDKYNYPGYISNEWKERRFELFQGELILKND